MTILSCISWREDVTFNDKDDDVWVILNQEA